MLRDRGASRDTSRHDCLCAAFEAGDVKGVEECKYPNSGDLEKDCQEALEQIERMGYEKGLSRMIERGC